MCVCVCICACVYVCMCVCVDGRGRGIQMGVLYVGSSFEVLMLENLLECSLVPRPPFSLEEGLGMRLVRMLLWQQYTAYGILNMPLFDI